MANSLGEFDYTDLLQEAENLADDSQSKIETWPDSQPSEAQDDVVIAVMGATGSGKSSFVKLLTGDDNIAVGNSLESETSDIQIIRYSDRLSGRNVTIVDTPGFDDSRESITDTEILKRITKFLLDMYDKDRKLNGLVYVQRISDPRFSGQSGRNLRMFRNLCGEGGYKNVVVLTTFWDKVTNAEEGKTREAQLKTKFFNELVQGGACFMQHDQTLEGAQNVLKHILTMVPTNVRIQEEIRVEGKTLEDTSAGSVHRKEVEELIAKHKQEVATLKSEMDEVGKTNTALAQDLKEERDRLQRKLEEWESERAELRKGLEDGQNTVAQLKANAENEKKEREQWRGDKEREWAKRLDSQAQSHAEELQRMKAEVDREKEETRKREERMEEMMRRLEVKAEEDRKALDKQRQEADQQWSLRLQTQADAHEKAVKMLQEKINTQGTSPEGIAQIKDIMNRLESKAKDDKEALEKRRDEDQLTWEQRVGAQDDSYRNAADKLRALGGPQRRPSENDKLQEALKRAREAEINAIKIQRDLDKERNKKWAEKGREAADAIPIVGVFAKPSLVIGGALLDVVSKSKKRR